MRKGQIIAARVASFANRPKAMARPGPPVPHKKTRYGVCPYRVSLVVGVKLVNA